MVTRAFKWLLPTALWLVAAGSYAQLGGIRGTVTDSDFEVPLPGVKIRVSETGQETQTGDAGSFYFEGVEPGAYTLLFSKSGYTRLTKPQVVVSAGQLAEIDALMAGEYEDMDELVVRDIQLGGASEIGLLNLRLESSALMDSVGADMMGQAGVSDAAQALSLVSGTTVQDGKYAVVRGLPDRYVVSLMNGVRLPSADPDKRAVQLDQFPSALIESVQVTKTFVPDQQGDASGGSVNVVLKSMPEDGLLKFSIGSKYKNSWPDDGEFLSYAGGGVGTWGLNDGRRDEQVAGTTWKGAVGTSRGERPDVYDWSLTAGGKKAFFDGVKVASLANFYYKTDASYTDDKRSDKWWVRNGQMVPFFSGSDNPLNNVASDYKTSLYDIKQGSSEVQWGGLAAVGLEVDDQTLSLLYMTTHVAEDKAIVAEDTRGKDYYVTSRVPGYDPMAMDDSPDYANAAPYRRSQTLNYTERDTSTLQLGGDHVLPVPEWEAGDWFSFGKPELDWTLAHSTSALKQPDKRLFGSLWNPGYREVIPGYRGAPPTTNTVDAGYYQDKPGSATLGNLQRVWKDVSEESDQYFLNLKIPFEQWSGEEGSLKTGLFSDSVERTYDQESYSNFGNPADNSINPYSGPKLPWSEYWTDQYPGPNDILYAATIDVDYEGSQDLSAWYYMAELPVTPYLTLIGGARFESTDLAITLINPEKDVLWVKPGESGASQLHAGDADVDFHQTDVLPSYGLQLKPLDTVTLRASYSETVARQTFKELTPIQQVEYLGGDVFVGNPFLQMSSLKNQDVRVDYAPYPGGLVSMSWFQKQVDQPIEYTQGYVANIEDYITAVNYPEGKLSGYEIECRQQLGQFWDALEGLAIGANATFIDSEVTLSDADAVELASAGYPEPKRAMMGAPEYLYNANVTYGIASSGTKLGLFYIVNGDALLAGANISEGYFPDVYAKEYATLNFTLSQKLTDHFSLSFKAKNLTDPEIQQVYRSKHLSGDTVKSSYTKGIEYSLGVKGTW